MITEEEYQIMKNQLLMMTDENDEIENKIQKLQAQNTQIPLLKQELLEAQTSLAKMNDEFEQEQLKLTSQFSKFSGQNENHEIKENEQKLNQLTENLQHVKSEFDRLSDEELQLAEQLANSAQKDNQLQILLEDADKFFQKYDIALPQLQACRMSGILIDDLLVQAENLKIAREAQHGRRFRLNGWKQQALAINETQGVAYSDLERDLKAKLDDLYKEEDNLSKIENTKAQVETRKSELSMSISKELNNVESMKQEASETMEKARKELEEMRATLENNKNEISEMRNTVQNYKRSEQKTIQKKLGIVRDLEKRLIQERQNLPTVSIDSPFVEELTKTVDAEMREREQMTKDFRAMERELKRVQEEASRKTQVIEEVSKVPPNDEPVSEDVSYADFLNLVKETEIKHLSFVSDLQGIAELLACAEQENDVLRETLSELSNPQ